MIDIPFGGMIERYHDALPSGAQVDYSVVDPPWLRFTMGTGDFIALSGAAVSMDRDLIIPCHEKNILSVRSFFAAHPKIQIVEAQKCEDSEALDYGIRLVVAREIIIPRYSPIDMFTHVYRTLDIPFADRWDKNPIGIASWMVEQIQPPSGQYIFVHEDPSRDYKIDRGKIKERQLPMIYPIERKGQSILAYAEIVRHAAAVHVIDSAFWWLTEMVGGIRGKPYLHRYARKPHLSVWSDYPYRQAWQVIN